ncbi:hypothetical protein ACW4TY_34475 (plasmid) [Streptomyces reniochalinae]|uniref:hypothetical protein n=1 Tax=Streptomyces reniochalinae TaxID=2250578 RepID=UPI0011C02234|nr:hypothetical protein [Streptomyces reniochalinae]
MADVTYTVRPGLVDGWDLIKVNRIGQGWALTTYKNRAVADFVADILRHADRMDEGANEGE